MADNDDEDEALLLIESKAKHVKSLNNIEKLDKIACMVEEIHTKNNEQNAIISEMTNSLETRMVEKIETLKVDYREALEKRNES